MRRGVHKQVKRTSLGDLESRVMEFLWTGVSADVWEVRQVLGANLPYTTVATALESLRKKQFLQRSKHVRAFRYSACISREEWEKRHASNLVSDALAEHSVESFVDCLLGDKAWDEAALARMERMIAERRRSLD